MQLACGEIKKMGASQELLNEDKMRVLEIVKRQLHVRLKYSQIHHKIVSFGILVQGRASSKLAILSFYMTNVFYLIWIFLKGLSVILLKMKMDLVKEEYLHS